MQGPDASAGGESEGSGARPPSRDEILEVVLRGASGFLDHPRIYAVRRGHLVGWLALVGDEVEGTQVREQSIALGLSPLIDRSVRGGVPYLGPVPDEDPCAAIGGSAPSAGNGLVIVPIVVAKRTACVLIARPRQALSRMVRDAVVSICSTGAHALEALLFDSKHLAAAGRGAAAGGGEATAAQDQTQGQETLPEPPPPSEEPPAVGAASRLSAEDAAESLPPEALIDEEPEEAATQSPPQPPPIPRGEALARNLAEDTPLDPPPGGWSGVHEGRVGGASDLMGLFDFGDMEPCEPEELGQRGERRAAIVTPRTRTVPGMGPSVPVRGSEEAPIPLVRSSPRREGAKSTTRSRPLTEDLLPPAGEPPLAQRSQGDAAAASPPDASPTTDDQAIAPGETEEAPPPRRAHPRYPLCVEVTHASDHNFFTGFLEDIGEGGIFVATHAFARIGERFEVIFTLPGLAEPETALCQVRWIRDYNPESIDALPGMGLQFETLSDRARQAIRAFIKVRQPIFFDD